MAIQPILKNRQEIYRTDERLLVFLSITAVMMMVDRIRRIIDAGGGYSIQSVVQLCYTSRSPSYRPLRPQKPDCWTNKEQ